MTMIQKLFVLIISIIVVLVGCSFGPKHTTPEIETPPDFRFSEEAQQDSIVNLTWWELFDDSLLDTLIQTALQNNKDIRIALSRIEESRSAFGFTNADKYPRLDIQGGGSRGNFVQGITLESESQNFFISPVVNWELDFWGKYRKASEAAQAELLATRLS